jgi:transposase
MEKQNKLFIGIDVSKAILELQELRSVERNLMEELHANQCRMERIKGKGTKYLEAHISFIKEEIEKVREEMEEVIESDEKLKNRNTLLKSYKGVGIRCLACYLPSFQSLER